MWKEPLYTDANYFYELHHSVLSETTKNLIFVCPWLDSNQTLSNRSN